MSMSGLSLRDLEYVVAVADHGSFVKAAEQCHVAQPSLSVQVSKLEARLRTVIFERTTRRLIVTPKGQQLVEQMRRVLVEARAIFALAGESQQPFGGSLRLSAISTLGPYVFPGILRDLRKRHPGLSVILGEDKTDVLLRALLQGELDVALVSTHGPEPAVAERAIFREPLVLACPEEHPACGSDGNGWEGLNARERLLLAPGHCLRDQALAASDDIAPSNRHATSLETLKYMVAAGEGCTLVPVTAATDVVGINYAPLPIERHSRVIYLAWRHSDPRARQFEELAAFLGPIVSARHPAILLDCR
jgi:LysR family transcriptional regulator, hydrogen peroxide-inducible genes activator